MEHVDVLIVGAGLSGIGAAYYIQTYCPKKSFAILEAREALGGTWDLFRYPGIRSDSDMYTLGYTFYPWKNPKAIADGESILNYLHETADAFNLKPKIRYKHRVCGMSWSSETSLWTATIQHGDETLQMTCNFVYFCMGYYDYDAGYTPQWQGIEQYKGRIVHPQKWDATLDYAGKSVIVIGSGATAVTLVPALAQKAAHVTMLQRTPSYVVNLPSEDKLANWMQRNLPAKFAYTFTRWKVILLNMVFYVLSRRYPQAIKRFIMRGVRDAVGEDYDVEKHFNPPYNPWDQRLCMVPDGDLFESIKTGNVTVVTDSIQSFTERGVHLASGKELEADIIVTATGLVMQLAKAGEIVVDGEVIPLSKTMSYKGTMISDVPNMAFAFGYTNASWTLKCELSSRYVCRLLNHMDAHGYKVAMPLQNDPTIQPEPVVNFTSGYVQRALSALPQQGSKSPWKLYQNYIFDLMTMQYGKVEDGVMGFK
jgi:cation diffusion facilitator CzcD-associated flavoprotein CzcO